MITLQLSVPEVNQNRDTDTTNNELTVAIKPTAHADISISTMWVHVLVNHWAGLIQFLNTETGVCTWRRMVQGSAYHAFICTPLYAGILSNIHIKFVHPPQHVHSIYAWIHRSGPGKLLAWKGDLAACVSCMQARLQSNLIITVYSFLQTDMMLLNEGVDALDTEITLVVAVGNTGPSPIQNATLDVFFPSRLEAITGVFTLLYPYDIVSNQCWSSWWFL